MNSISIIIITKNVETDIERCLKSVKWADEIIIVDSGSTDKTVEICQRYTDKIIVTNWLGFGQQKNRALSYATKSWVLSIDADEWLDEKLALEIRQTLKAPQANAYALPRCSKFCGKFIKHGAWGNDWVTRLFKRGNGKFTDDKVHEKLLISGTTQKLKHWLWHDSCKNLETAINKMNSYSELSAQMKFEQAKRSNFFAAIFRGLWTFLKAYFFQLGFLDGKAGFILSVVTAEGSYYRYLKLMYLQETMNDKKNY